jgi:hypothetical protein
MEASRVRAGSELLDDLPGAQVILVGVRIDEVEVELTGMDLGEEVPRLAKSSRSKNWGMEKKMAATGVNRWRPSLKAFLLGAQPGLLSNQSAASKAHQADESDAEQA